MPKDNGLEWSLGSGFADPLKSSSEEGGSKGKILVEEVSHEQFINMRGEIPARNELKDAGYWLEQNSSVPFEASGAATCLLVVFINSKAEANLVGHFFSIINQDQEIFFDKAGGEREARKFPEKYHIDSGNISTGNAISRSDMYEREMGIINQSGEPPIVYLFGQHHLSVESIEGFEGLYHGDIEGAYVGTDIARKEEVERIVSLGIPLENIIDMRNADHPLHDTCDNILFNPEKKTIFLSREASIHEDQKQYVFVEPS